MRTNDDVLSLTTLQAALLRLRQGQFSSTDLDELVA